MKKTGVYRHLDALGRIVLPMEMRNILNLKNGDALDIAMEGDSIILKKRLNSCIICNSKENLVDFEGKHICNNCLQRIKAVD